MPTLTLLSTNTSINATLFELVKLDQAVIFTSTSTQVLLSVGSTIINLRGTGLTVVDIDGRSFINGGTVTTIQVRLANTDFNITNLILSGNILGQAMLSDFNGSDQGAVERLFLGMNFEFVGTPNNDTHIRTITNSLDGQPLLLTGNNIYNMGAGDDRIIDAGTGNDTIFGGASGFDELHGGAGNDSLQSGDVGKDTLFGGAGNDTLSTNNGSPDMFGGANNDLLVVNQDILLPTTLDGGTGNDTLSLAGRTVEYDIDLSLGGMILKFPELEIPVSLIGVENVIGGDRIDRIRGTDGDNLLDGRGGGDALDGGRGNDTLIAGGGADNLLNGGDGDDLLILGGTMGEFNGFLGGAGIDTFSMQGSSVGYIADLSFSSLRVIGGTIATLFGQFENLVGSDHADRLIGSNTTLNDPVAGHNLLDGRGGNDTIEGEGGSDTLIGGQGIDSLNGGSGDDVLVVGSVGLSQGGEVYDGSFDIDTFSLEGVNFDGYRVNLAAGTANTLSGGFQVTLRDIEIVIGSVDGDEITGSDGADTLEGRQGADTLFGGGSGDLLDGGIGADRMFGGAGSDRYFVDDAGDVVSETALGQTTDQGGAADTVVSSVSYSLETGGAAFIERLQLTGNGNLFGTGNALDNEITGNTGNNFLFGLGGNDTIFGGNGNDSLIGGAGDNSLFGGQGDDFYGVQSGLDVVSETSDGLTDDGGFDVVGASVSFSLDGTDGRQFIENLFLEGETSALDATGNGLANTITGNDNDNRLRGLGGDDTLVGSLGNDTLFGGSGDDLYVISDALDVASEAEDGTTDDGGTDLVEASVSYSLTGAPGLQFIENLTLSENPDAVEGTGNALSNTLIGNSANNVLNGAGGNDTMDGGAGDDTYITDGDDTIIEDADEGTDTVQSSVNHTLGANLENLILTGSSDLVGVGNGLFNTITGNSGSNRLNGGGGADTLSGGGGDDRLFGEAGNDLFITTGENFDGSSFGGRGDDTFVFSNAFFSGNIFGGRGVDHVDAGAYAGFAIRVDLAAGTYDDGLERVMAGIEHVTAGDGNDTLVGSAAPNRLIGNDGDDILNGGRGNDLLVGGAGNDVFVFNGPLARLNIDRITDFTANGDKIHLDSAVFAGLATGTVGESAFASNTTGRATDAFDRIIYETDTGRLYFDADGSGAGARVQFARLTDNLPLTGADFFVF